MNNKNTLNIELLRPIIINKIYWYIWQNKQKLVCQDIRLHFTDIIIDYIYLTADERQAILQIEHEYLFDV